MNNAEKYLKDGVDIEELSNEIVMFEVKEIGWQIAEKEKERIKRFFEQSVKPTLSEDEKVILRHRPLDHEYIGRDSFGLYISQFDDRLGSYFYWKFSNAFDSIKIGEEYKISDLLEE